MVFTYIYQLFDPYIVYIYTNTKLYRVGYHYKQPVTKIAGSIYNLLRMIIMNVYKKRKYYQLVVAGTCKIFSIYGWRITQFTIIALIQ